MNGEKTNKEKWWNWLSILILILIAFILALAAPIVFVRLLRYPVIIGQDLIYKYPPAEMTLSAFLCFSVIALVVALTFTVYIFKYLNLTNPNHTLGLPEGSIRAVIALSLILIFMISSVFLYIRVSTIESTGEINLSQAEYDNISKELIYSAKPVSVPSNVSGNLTYETRYIVRLQTAGSEESVDIAKQIITTVSTLVVAVAGFYFGSNSVAAASKAATGAGRNIPIVPDPFIRKIKPTVGTKGKEDILLEIMGENLNSPKEVKLIRELDTIPCKDVTWSDTMIHCKLEIPDKPEKVGTWTVVVVNSQGTKGSLENGFTVE